MGGLRLEPAAGKKLTEPVCRDGGHVAEEERGAMSLESCVGASGGRGSTPAEEAIKGERSWSEDLLGMALDCEILTGLCLASPFIHPVFLCIPLSVRSNPMRSLSQKFLLFPVGY